MKSSNQHWNLRERRKSFKGQHSYEINLILTEMCFIDDSGFCASNGKNYSVCALLTGSEDANPINTQKHNPLWK